MIEIITALLCTAYSEHIILLVLREIMNIIFKKKNNSERNSVFTGDYNSIKIKDIMTFNYINIKKNLIDIF